MWTRYEVAMEFTGKVMGGIPKNTEVIKAWLEARMPSEAVFARMPNPTPIATLAEEVAEAVGATDEKEQKVWSGFMSDESGLYVPGFHIKAHLKDVANILQKQIGIKALKAKVADRFFVEEEKVYLGKMEPDGYWEHPVHIMTMQGPRSALKRNDYVERPRLVFTFKMLDDKIITEKILNSLFEYGGIHGFGAERGLGNGRYNAIMREL